eukprot:6162098-Prymnesium_polylepis.1
MWVYLQAWTSMRNGSTSLRYRLFWGLTLSFPRSALDRIAGAVIPERAILSCETPLEASYVCTALLQASLDHCELAGCIFGIGRSELCRLEAVARAYEKPRQRCGRFSKAPNGP